MSSINIDYLYGIYFDEYEDEDNILSREEFIEAVETIIEDQIRAKEL